MINSEQSVSHQNECRTGRRCYVAQVTKALDSFRDCNARRFIAAASRFPEVVTGDPRKFRNVKWSRLVNGDDVAVILNNSYDAPLLPPSHVSDGMLFTSDIG